MTGTQKKKSYKPDILKTHTYNGKTIQHVHNHKTDSKEYKTRFEFNRKVYRLKADTFAEIKKLIDETTAQARLKKYDLPAPKVERTVKELFERHLQTIKKRHQKVMAKRVFELFLDLLPYAELPLSELKKAHFQTFIDYRLGMDGERTGKPIEPQTVNREISILSAAVHKAESYFAETENWNVPKIPKAKTKFRRRERTVSASELSLLLAELRKPMVRKDHQFFRERLADWIEFSIWTGLRRKEIARLKFSQYSDGALRNVQRWKTDSTTAFFPLSQRAAEIVENRKARQNGSEYIFTPDGKPIEAHYRCLKEVCTDLDIPYGRFNDGGFVPHDMRRSFATSVIEHTDIETARELLGHSNIKQTGEYLMTSRQRMISAIRKTEGFDVIMELEKIFDETFNKKLDKKSFVERVKKLLNF